MKQVIDLMSRLRSRGGCPWDREQTLESLQQYLIEECYELIDAVDSGEVERHMDELGDVLLQVVFQAQIRKEQGKFTFDDVVKTLAAKLIRRHPHIFGSEKARTPAQVLKRWEAIKAQEKKDKGESTRSAVDGVPNRLPALLKAQRVQARASRVGFDWKEVEGVVAKIEEELAEVKQAMSRRSEKELKHEIGDLLFAVVNLSRFKRISAELALESAVNRFVRRFKAVEARVHRKGRRVSECSLEELEKHWQAVKVQHGRQ
ncbi:MAG: nucleoside triphosphate pyrophosphohydrolase [bacterium]